MTFGQQPRRTPNLSEWYDTGTKEDKRAMNDYNITVVFRVRAERLEQAYKIVEHEVGKNVRFKGVPYAESDSGIVNYNNLGVQE